VESAWEAAWIVLNLSFPSMNKACQIAVLALLAAFSAAADTKTAAAPPLFRPKGVQLSDVQQGSFGSCYFHSVVGALAQANPARLHDMIADNHDGTFTVTFAD